MMIQSSGIFLGDDIRNTRYKESSKAGNDGNAHGKFIDGTTLNLRSNPAAAKREEAKKKAMRIVGDAFAHELKIDDDIKFRREKIKSLQRDIGDANSAVKEIEDSRAALRDIYSVKADSREEQDLKLLEKEIKYKIPGNNVHFDDGDLERIEQLKKNGLTEYQQRSLEMLESEVPYAKSAYENKQEIMIENQIISATKLERLKTNPMKDAQEQADAIMDETSKEITQMLVDEAKGHIEEEADKSKEKAETEKEKEEEPVTDVNGAQQEVKDMMSKMKLIEEDIKGAAVDKSL